MPKALVINPNTSEWMTDAIRKSANGVFSGTWNYQAVQLEGGPETIDSWVDTSIATIAMLSLIRQNEDVDGIVIACFGDPGLFTLREIVDVPVVGIAEAGFLTACMIGFRFGILGGSSKDIPWMESILWGYGIERRCAGVEPINMSVSDTGEDLKDTLDALANASRKLKSYGAESVILGCGGWGGFRKDLELMVNLPVIDPGEAGCWQLRALVEMNLSSSRVGMYIKPSPKKLTNIDSVLAPNLAKWLAKKAGNGFKESHIIFGIFQTIYNLKLGNRLINP